MSPLLTPTLLFLGVSWFNTCRKPPRSFPSTPIFPAFYILREANLTVLVFCSWLHNVTPLSPFVNFYEEFFVCISFSTPPITFCSGHVMFVENDDIGDLFLLLIGFPPGVPSTFICLFPFQQLLFVNCLPP